MAVLTTRQQRALGGLQRTLQKIKLHGVKAGSKITHLVYTKDSSGNLHHVYKEGKNLVSQGKKIGTVKPNQKFVQAMNGMALVKKISTDPYAKLLKGGKIRKSALAAIAKRIA